MSPDELTELNNLFATAGFTTFPIQLSCPYCGVPPDRRCVTAGGNFASAYHSSRANAPGYSGRLPDGRQFCLTCHRWKFPAIHSCRGVSQV